MLFFKVRELHLSDQMMLWKISKLQSVVKNDNDDKKKKMIGHIVLSVCKMYTKLQAILRNIEVRFII